MEALFAKEILTGEEKSRIQATLTEERKKGVLCDVLVAKGAGLLVQTSETLTDLLSRQRGEEAGTANVLSRQRGEEATTNVLSRQRRGGGAVVSASTSSSSSTEEYSSPSGSTSSSGEYHEGEGGSHSRRAGLVATGTGMPWDHVEGMKCWTP